MKKSQSDSSLIARLGAVSVTCFRYRLPFQGSSMTCRRCRITTCVFPIIIVAQSVFGLSQLFAEPPEMYEFVNDLSVVNIKLAYDKLFAGADRDTLRSLRANDSDSIAIQSAWETLVRRLPYDSISAGERWVRPSKAGVHRFLGVIEGRLRVEIPVWWEVAIVAARVRGIPLYQSNLKRSAVELRFPRTPLVPSPYSDEEIEFEGWQVRTGHRLWYKTPKPHSRDIVELKYEGATIELPQSLFSEAGVGKHFGVNMVKVDDGSMLVLIHSLMEGRGRLSRVEVKPYQELWHCVVHGEFYPGARFNVGFDHVTDLLVTNDVVYVFGAVSTSAYIEGFALHDGRVRVRVSTSY